MADRPEDRDDTRFPDPVYARTVLAPLYDHAKTLFGEPLMRVDRAHCVMLGETGILCPRDTAKIAGALAEIEASDILGPSTYSGEYEDLFFEVEAALKARLGDELGGKLHVGRSRNDLDHAVLRIRLKAELDTFLASGRTLARTLLDTADRNRAVIVVAYTHGQPAQPTTYGHYLAAALETLLRDLHRLEAARAIVDLSPMGAAAITTTGFPVDRHRMAELLGFSEPTRNSYLSIAGVDYITSAYSAVSLTMLHLGRLVQDFQYWTGFETGQLYIRNALVQISSIMPQKRNPVPVEHLRHLASTALGQAETVVRTMHNTPFTDMNDSEGEVQATGLKALETAARVTDLLAALLREAEVRPENARRTIERSCITITELADTLVRSEGLSFRQAHHIAADVARSVTTEGGDLSDGYAAFRAAFSSHAGHPPALEEAGYRRAVDPEHFVAVRDRYGGPSREPMEEALDAYAADLAALDGLAARHRAAEAEAAHKLQEAFRVLRETDGKE